MILCDADKRVEFLAALIKDAGRKVFLILDNLRVHHSRTQAKLCEATSVHMMMLEQNPELLPRQTCQAGNFFVLRVIVRGVDVSGDTSLTY